MNNNKKRKVFLIGTFVQTFVSWIILANLISQGILEYNSTVGFVIFAIGGISPTMWGIIATILADGKYGLIEMGKSTIKYNAKWYWYIFGFGGFLLIGFLFCYIDGNVMARPWITLLTMLPINIIYGGLEEFGWRGTFQKSYLIEFDKKKNAFPLFLLIQIPIWAIWHFPLFFIEGTSQFEAGNTIISIIAFSIGIVGVCIIHAIIYRETESILICVILHAFCNSVMNVFPWDYGILSALIASGVITIVLFLYIGIKNKKLFDNNQLKNNAEGTNIA
jgi:hypothetical protein